jgi:hypothetical protein
MLALEGGCSAWEGDSQDSVDGDVYDNSVARRLERHDLMRLER